MLKEAETEETMNFFVTFYHWWYYNRGVGPPAGYAYDWGGLLEQDLRFESKLPVL